MNPGLSSKGGATLVELLSKDALSRNSLCKYFRKVSFVRRTIFVNKTMLLDAQVAHSSRLNARKVSNTLATE